MKKITAKAQGVLFDNDGVLISSIGSVNRCWRRWAKLYDIPDADNYQVPHGKRAIEIVRELRPDIDAEQGLRVIEDLEIADTEDLTVLPGVRELLKKLPAERWAIVTSATLRLLEGRWKAAGLPFPERLIAGDMVERGKPDPEPYRKGAELLGFRPEDCIVVEDAPSGILAGKSAGCRVLAVLGTHEPDELADADWIVQSLDLIEIELLPDGINLVFPTVVAV